MKEPKTVVVFRVFRDEGDLIALFPEIEADHNGHCESYQHIGQHGGADYPGCIQVSRPATRAEYRTLARELRGRGYRLDIRQRRPARRLMS